MKSFKKYLDKPTHDVKTLSKKHGVSIEYLKKQLKAGISVEKEHTNDSNVAKEIALDHLGERPDYYVKLKKVEDE